MPLVMTPKQLRLQGEFYHQLSVLTSAGLPLLSALSSLEKNPPNRSFRKPLAQVQADVNQGFTFAESVRRVGNWLPTFDIALLEAGEQSGRLDHCFALLSGYYHERSSLASETLGHLAYPVLVIHVAVFLGPLPGLVLGGNVATYLAQTLGVLLPLYFFVGVLLFACQGRHGERWRSVVERFVRMIPILGVARRHLALARLSIALEGLINAGVPIIGAWEIAAEASGSPALGRAVRAWRPRLEDGGELPSEVIERSTEFPDLFANLYRTGEISGSLDESLRRLHKYYQEDASGKLRALAQWFPRLIYFGVAMVVAFRVVSFYSGYFSGIMNTN